MGFPIWEPARRCTSGPTPGALAMMKWFLEEYGNEGGYNLGIYNCRAVRGGSTTSLHGEGRACDFGFPIGDPDGDECRANLVKRAGSLGIQCVIYERRIFSARSPKGRYYGGVNPHNDHLHVELTHEAASELSYATIVDVLTPGLPRYKRGTRILHKGMHGTDVRFVQRKVGVKRDGYFGPQTKAAVEDFEAEMRATLYPRMWVDGVVGGLTWKAFGITPAL